MTEKKGNNQKPSKIPSSPTPRPRTQRPEERRDSTKKDTTGIGPREKKG